jgi:hypothetical protein
VSLSERSLKLPPSESESFTISPIVSFLINMFYEVFSELTLSPCFFMLLVLHKSSANCWDHIHTVARHGIRKVMEFAGYDGMQSAVI